MRTQRDDEGIVERLQKLTIDGQLNWRPMYSQSQPSSLSDEDMEDYTMPAAYMLKDQMHGFGLVSVRVHDPENEITGEPVLFIQGEQADVDLQEVGILLDAIQTHLNEIREGERQSVRDRIDERVEEEVAPYQEELARKEASLRQEREEKQELLEAVQALAVGSQDSDPDQPPLTVETFREALRGCIEDVGDLPETFQVYFDEDAVARSIEQVDGTESDE